MRSFTATERESFDSFLLRDERVWCGQDTRVSFSAFGSRDASVPLVYVEEAATLGAELGSFVGRSEAGGSLMLVGGGFAQHTSVVWSDHRDFELRRSSLAPHVRAAVRHSLREADHVMSPSVRPDDLAMLLDVPDVRVGVIPAAPHYILEVGRARSFPQFLDSLSGKHRRTWATDFELAASENLTHTTSVLTSDVCREAAHDVVATSKRNGVSEHPLLAEWRLQRYLGRPGEHYAAELLKGPMHLGYVAWTKHDRTLIAHTVAISSDVEFRSLAYHYAFTCVLSFALQNGITSIAFGREHGTPKQARGCRSEPRWQITYDTPF
ncbi:hypothetical protein CQ040_16695 [Microbacterium sp. MYb54]|nr:hypothetical protein CQ032_16325 [Microbacterium sp. MYb43]PQZ73267.1 hypothetical protein CQ031_17680 [Microbacterium sp. MYb40]PRB18713.1 hypothetical protein CQ040_16695 [Microbacterium sp. MYb54]PRB24394.1 hypothetical protein CQ037_17100 [Microbacterium sp. MYb50]PRB64442.1 hypothetical protein CQ027_20050 [Microbacterium sp. MYb32]PRB67258.1 hypothetical protein CQ021_08405 [Microbacterium sp. MYb24]